MTTRTTITKVEKWTWVLIFIGMAVFGIGLSVARTDSTLGHVISGLAVVAVIVGVALIWARSRLHEGKSK
jgi:hypothetical protein